MAWKQRDQKMKHNKKRNTAFLFETLASQLTRAIVRKDNSAKAATKNLISKHFRKGTNLYEELQLYKAITETKGLEAIVAEKLIYEVKARRLHMADADVFKEQSSLIDDMNKEYGKAVFSTFVPNYKSLATISQLFNFEAPVKERVLLESSIIEHLTGEEGSKPQEMKPIDSLVYKTFVEKFNEKYSDTLSEEQKNLLGKYISSFADNGLGLKVFLNEEIGRLKKVLETALESPEIKSDNLMLENTNKVIEELRSYSQKPIDEGVVKKILKIQQLALEIVV